MFVNTLIFFPENLPRLPPRREAEFHMDLILDVTLNSKTKYRFVPTELIKLKKKLDYLLEIGFIRPSLSPWGAPTLLRKKDRTMRLCITIGR